jgi:hypothetical protein
MGKTLLFFVFRDHTESETPLELLIEAIRKDMDVIWKGIVKVCISFSSNKQTN